MPLWPTTRQQRLPRQRPVGCAAVRAVDFQGSSFGATRSDDDRFSHIGQTLYGGSKAARGIPATEGVDDDTCDICREAIVEIGTAPLGLPGSTKSWDGSGQARGRMGSIVSRSTDPSASQAA